MFEEKYNQLLSSIGDHKTMVLSTAVHNTAYSRMMSIVQFGKKFYFQTDCKMDKYSQLKLSPNVSLCFDNVSFRENAQRLAYLPKMKNFANCIQNTLLVLINCIPILKMRFCLKLRRLQ